MEIIYKENPKKEAGKELSLLIEKYKDTPILLLLSGGSAFSLLEYTETSFLNEKDTLGVLDERYSKDPLVNNFLQLQNTSFFKRTAEKHLSYINSSIQENEGKEELTNILEKNILGWLKQNKEGKVIVTMGIGEDGHTAGILPIDTSSTFFEGERLILSYSVPLFVNQYTERITVTYPFLRKYVDEAIVFAEGEKKQKIIEKLKNEEGSLSQVPAFILKEMKSVKIFTSTQ